MKRPIRHPARFLLLTGVYLVLSVAGCSPETPEKFIASGNAYLAKRDFPAAVIQFKNAVHRAPDSPEARYLLATALEQVDDPAGAEIELRKAAAAGYAAKLVYPALVRVMLAQGQFNNALAEALEQQRANPAKIELLALAGTAQSGLGKLDEARASFSAALTAEPFNQTAMLGMVGLAVRERDLPRARQLVDQILEHDPSCRDALILKGDLLVLDQRGKEASHAYDKALELRPRSLAVYIRLVPVLVREGDLNAAQARTRALKQFAPKAAITLYLDALVAHAQGDRVRARESVDNALKAAPDFVPALLLAGTVAHDSGNYAQAEQHLRRVIRASPGQIYARRLLVSTYLRSGQPDRAQEALDALLRIAPNDATNLSLAGQVALANRDIDQAAEEYQKALSLDPDNAQVHMRLGQVHMAAGDTERAVQDLEAATAADASLYQADIALVVLHLKRRELEKAQAAVEGLAKKQPDNPVTYNLIGLVQLAKENQEGARKNFERALELQPTYLPAARNLAILDVRAGHTEAAKRRYEAIIARQPKNDQSLLALFELLQKTGAPAADVENAIDRAIAADPGSAGPRLIKIDYLLQRGDAKGALSAAQQAQAALPQTLSILQALGRAQVAAGENDQAIATFGKLASLSPKSPLPLVAQAAVYEVIKDWAGARKSLQKAIDLKPDLAVARWGLVHTLIQAERFEEARTEAREMEKRWPAQPAGYLAEADVLIAQKDWNEAERQLRAAVQKTNSPAVVTRLYSFLDRQGRTQDADAFARAWMDKNPKDALVATYLGGLSTQRNDYASAARWYKSALKAQPSNVVVLNNLAWVLGQLHDAGAFEYGQKALSLAPNAPQVLDTVGWLYIERGDFTRGLELLNKAHSLAPDATNIQLNLAKALIKSGQGKAAREQLEALARLPPGTPIRDEAQKLLSSL